MSSEDTDIFFILKVTDHVFTSLKNMDLDYLATCESSQLSGALPFLAKLLLNPYFTKRKQVLRLLNPHARTNDIIHMMQAKAIEPSDINFVGEDKTPLDVVFESGSLRDRLRVVAVEYLRIHEISRQPTNPITNNHGATVGSTNVASNNHNNNSMKLQKSWLFDNPLYFEEVALCFYALLNKPTTIPVINLLDLCETLLRVKQGSSYILYIATNLPDRCYEVCHHLITLGERCDEGPIVNEISDQRSKSVRLLCRMDPRNSFRIQRFAVQSEMMPSLVIMITVDRLQEFVSLSNEENCDNQKNGRVELWKNLNESYESTTAFITGILLGKEEGARTWFAQYLKSAQKRIDSNQPTILSSFKVLMLDVIQKLHIDELDEIPYYSTNGNDDSLDSNESGNQVKDSESLRLKLIQMIATLRYFCALRGVGMLKLENEESETLLTLITAKPAPSQTSVIFATVGVCTLLVCSSTIHSQKEERRAAEWLKWLIRESGYNDPTFSGHGRCSISELLLLIAIHFQNNQTNQVAELVCATLGMKLQIKASVSKCKSLFVHEVFNDQMIAEHAVQVPVTHGLNDTYTEFLPIHCIHQLLESRSFSKHQVPIQNWIYRQICQSRKPIHHMLPKLIDAFVNSVVVSTSIHGHCGTNQPIPEEDIASIFKMCLYAENRAVSDLTKDAQEDARPQRKKKKTKKERSPKPMEVCDQLSIGGSSEDVISDVIDYEVSQVLTLYYLTLYEDVRLKKSGDLSSADRAKLITYNPEFMIEIPVFYLMQLVRDNQDMFGAVLPYLLKLVASQYPHLCSVQHWLNTTEHYEPYRSRIDPIEEAGSPNSRTSQRISKTSRSTLKSQSHRNDLLEDLSASFGRVDENPLCLARVIHTITNMPRRQIWTFVDIFMKNWRIILSLGDSLEDQKLSKVMINLWWKLNAVFPRRLWVMTTNSLRKSQKDGLNCVETRSLEHSWNELTSDPLIVLRCDSRVYRHRPMLYIILHILNGFLAATKRCLHDQIYDQLTRQRDNRNLEELRATLVLAQTSAAIQILLESCIPNDIERKLVNKRDMGICLTDEEQAVLRKFDDSVDCICENLHQVFIEDTNLAKLVHFQTYPSELLATTSSKIPSMHICLDFIPELLRQPDLSRQVFVIELTSHLCEKYAITKSLNVAKLCFNVAFTLLQLLPSDKRATFYIPVLPALLRICKVFPILHEDFKIILGQINQITLAHIASTSSRLSLRSSQPFEGLDKMSWHEVNKLMRSLTLDEALFLCVHKCLVDTCYRNH